MVLTWAWGPKKRPRRYSYYEREGGGFDYYESGKGDQDYDGDKGSAYDSGKG